MFTFGTRGTKLASIAASLSMIAMSVPAVAFADAQPGVGGQSGGGSTAMTIQFMKSGEYGGTDEPQTVGGEGNPYYNPAGDDGLGVNLAFTVPSRIDFVAKANGDVLAPSDGAVKVENRSSYAIHVSSLKVNQNENWNIVEDASSSSAANAVSINIGPVSDQLNIASYKNAKAEVSKPFAWNMAAYDGDDTTVTDVVAMNESGHIANVNLDLSSAETFGTIQWYISAGSAARTGAPYTATFAAYPESESDPLTVLATATTDDEGFLVLDNSILQRAGVNISDSETVFFTASTLDKMVRLGDTVKLTGDTTFYFQIAPAPTTGSTNPTLTVQLNASMYDQTLEHPQVLASSTISPGDQYSVPDYPGDLTSTQTFIGWSPRPNVKYRGASNGVPSNISGEATFDSAITFYAGEKIDYYLIGNYMMDYEQYIINLYPVILDTSKPITVRFFDEADIDNPSSSTTPDYSYDLLAGETILMPASRSENVYDWSNPEESMRLGIGFRYRFYKSIDLYGFEQ